MKLCMVTEEVNQVLWSGLGVSSVLVVPVYELKGTWINFNDCTWFGWGAFRRMGVVESKQGQPRRSTPGPV